MEFTVNAFSLAHVHASVCVWEGVGVCEREREREREHGNIDDHKKILLHFGVPHTFVQVTMYKLYPLILIFLFT